ncbi:MAG: hypothetical protein MK102_04105 [Fuerstiella sp.]|nr:hypothetical protein [Fuerstiella sp.]
MNRIPLILVLVLMTTATCCETCAQNNQPQITIAHPGVTDLTADLLSLTRLAPPDEQQYGEELEAFLQDISIGMAVSKPIRIDALAASGTVSYLIWIAYEDQDEFLLNLESIGFPAFQQASPPGFFLLDAGPDKGWLQFLKNSNYAALALSTPDTHDVVMQYVLEADDPAPAFVKLEKDGASALLTLHNTERSDDSQVSRRDVFQVLREKELKAVQQRPSESTSKFELRKDAWSIFYDELERLYVEAAEFNLWSDLNQKESTLSISFDSVGIPKTSMAESIAEFGQVPDAFAEIQPIAENVLSGRMNVSIDCQRQTNANEFLDLLTIDVHNRINNSTTLKDTEKQATRVIYDDVATLFREGFASGNVNGFVEGTHNGTDFTIVGAVSSPESASLTETLKQLPLARSGNSVDQNFASAGGITIHKIQLAKGFIELADDLFGVGSDFYVGVGHDQIWLATGPGSPELMQSKIEELGSARQSEMVLSVDIGLSPWINRLHELADQRPIPAAVEDRAVWRENLLRLKQLSAALGTADHVNMSVNSSDGNFSGTVQMNKGILRFFGRRIALLTKEILDL